MKLGPRGTTTPSSTVPKRMAGVRESRRGAYMTGPRSIYLTSPIGPRQGRSQAVGGGSVDRDPLLDLGPLLPPQLAVEEPRHPEHRMFLAMLLDCISVLCMADAIRAATATCEHRRAQKLQIALDVEWVFFRCDPIISFDTACEVLNIDPAAAREGLMKIVQRTPILIQIMEDLANNGKERQAA